MEWRKKIVVYEVPKKSINFGLTRVFFIENSSFLKSKILNISWNADKILKKKNLKAGLYFSSWII